MRNGSCDPAADAWLDELSAAVSEGIRLLADPELEQVVGGHAQGEEICEVNQQFRCGQYCCDSLTSHACRGSVFDCGTFSERDCDDKRG